ncbi:MAG: hypothetical protein PHY72_03125 [Candidatus Pacebacteria bacterium]|nr:hypothetical protein [Candidatus Paceibacterota bacterium]
MSANIMFGFPPEKRSLYTHLAKKAFEKPITESMSEKKTNKGKEEVKENTNPKEVENKK